MTKILTALATLIAALAIAPLASAQVCADCDGGGGGGGGGGGNASPTAAFTYAPASPQTLQNVTFTNGSTDSDGTIASSSWTFGDGGSSTTTSPQHAYGAGGTYTVTLTVTDNNGAQTSVSHDVTVTNQAPTANFTAPSVGFPGEPVAFTGSANDPEGALASYSWNFGDNGMADVLSPQHTYAAAGTYEVSFVAYDNQGAPSTLVKKSIRINAAPTAHINPVQDGVAGQLFSFTSTNADSDGSITKSCWDYGDGTSGCGGGNPSHTYAASGDYTAKLTVTDNDGSTGTDTIQVHIAPAPVDNSGGGGDTTGGGDNTGGGSNTGGGGGSTNGGGGSSTNTNGGGGSTGTPGSTPAPGTPASPSAADKTAPAITVPASVKAKKKAGKVAVAITSNEAVTVVAKLTGKVKASVTTKVNGKGQVVIKFTSKAKKAIKAAKVVKLTLTITATDAAGNKTTKTVKVSLV